MAGIPQKEFLEKTSPGTKVVVEDFVAMDTERVVKNPGDDPVVRVQCFGDANVHVINTQFAAVLQP